MPGHEEQAVQAARDMLRRSRLLTAATAATALIVQQNLAEAKASLGTSLPALHEALLTSPAGRRYAAAAPLGSSLSWALSFASQDLRVDDPPKSQLHVCRLDAEGASPLAASLPADGGTSITASPQHGLELRQFAVEGGKKLAVEVWLSSGVRVARRVVNDVGVKVLAPGVFGRPHFSPSGSVIAWAAERLPAGAEAAGYWPKGLPTAGAEEIAAPEVLEGKYSLADARSTGEALLVHSSVLVVWDWRRDELRVLKPEEFLDPSSLGREGVAVAAHPIFDGSDEGLIFGCHLLPPWRPGISACLNRPTRLYHLHLPRPPLLPEAEDAPTTTAASPMAVCLTPDVYFAHFPRLSPDGRTLAFAARSSRFAGHSTTFDLRTMPWPRPTPSDAPVPVSQVLLGATAPVEVAAAAAGTVFPGWCGFHDELGSLAWLNASTLVFNSIAGARKAAYTLQLPRETGSMPTTAAGAASAALTPTPLRPPSWDGGSVELIGTHGGVAVLTASSLRSPPTVWARSNAPAGERWQRLVDTAALINDGLYWPSPPAAPTATANPLALAEASLSAVRGARLERVSLDPASGGAEAIVLLPQPLAGSAPSSVVRGRPWVLRPHGGPHSACVDAFNVEIALLLASGIAVILPNYRGSLGYGAAFAEALLGRVGEMDVADCAALTRAALAAFPDELDPGKGAVYGGSHGGFLTAWLLGSEEHNRLYSCGVLWNPVVDLAGMACATDIPEWVAAEGLGSPDDFQWPLTLDQVRARHAPPTPRPTPTPPPRAAAAAPSASWTPTFPHPMLSR